MTSPPDETHLALLKKVLAGEADGNEKKRFYEIHKKRSLEILEKPLDALFIVSPAQRDLPKKAKIDRSIPCTLCGEPTMAAKMIEKDGLRICRDCNGG